MREAKPQDLCHFVTFRIKRRVVYSDGAIFCILPGCVNRDRGATHDRSDPYKICRMVQSSIANQPAPIHQPFPLTNYQRGNPVPDQNFDVIIIGGGMAGLTAGIYAARHGLSTAIVEQMMAGAQIINLERIENFPGFPQGIAGYELGPATQEQAMNAGVEVLMDTVASVSADGDYLRVSGEGGDFYLGKAVIMAAGSTLRTLGIPGEEEFLGRGVSHCASCDGPLYMGQTVAVVGGGDSAADEALTLTDYTERVLLFHRGDELDAQQVLQDRIAAESKIEVRYNSEVVEVVGEDTVTGVRVRSADGENVEPVAGLFIYVGLEPNSSPVSDLVPLDNAGHIPVGLSMDTPQPGLFAAGDIRQQSAAQLVASAGDGATAAIAAHRYIRSREW